MVFVKALEIPKEEMQIQKTLDYLYSLKQKIPESARNIISALDYAIKSYEAAAASWKTGDKKGAFIFQQNAAQSYAFAVSKISGYENDTAGLAVIDATIAGATKLRDEIRKTTQTYLDEDSTPVNMRKPLMQQGIANISLLNQIIDDAQKQKKIVEENGIAVAKDLQKFSHSWGVAFSAVAKSFEAGELAREAMFCERLLGAESKAVEKTFRDAAAAFTRIAENAFNLRSTEKLEQDIKSAFADMADAFSNSDSFLKNRIESMTNQMAYWMIAQVRGVQPEFTPTQIEAAQRNYSMIAIAFFNIEGETRREGAYNLAIRNFRTVRDITGKTGQERIRAEETYKDTRRMLEDYIPAEIQSTKNFNTMMNLTKLVTSFVLPVYGLGLAFHNIYEQYKRMGNVRGIDISLAAAGIVVPGLGKLGKRGKTLAALVGLTAFGAGTVVGVNDLYKSIQAFRQQNPGQELDTNKLIELSAQAAAVLYPLGYPARAAYQGIKEVKPRLRQIVPKVKERIINFYEQEEGAVIISGDAKKSKVTPRIPEIYQEIKTAVDNLKLPGLEEGETLYLLDSGKIPIDIQKKLSADNDIIKIVVNEEAYYVSKKEFPPGFPPAKEFRVTKNFIEVKNVFIIDTSYVIKLIESNAGVYESLKELADIGDVIITRQVLEEVKAHTKQTRQLVKRENVSELFRTINEGIISLEKTELTEELMRELSEKMKKVSDKKNSRVGKGDASIYEIAKIATDLYERVSVFSADQDVVDLLRDLKNIQVQAER